jgi:hypothetical protein
MLYCRGCGPMAAVGRPRPPWSMDATIPIVEESSPPVPFPPSSPHCPDQQITPVRRATPTISVGAANPLPDYCLVGKLLIGTARFKVLSHKTKSSRPNRVLWLQRAFNHPTYYLTHQPVRVPPRPLPPSHTLSLQLSIHQPHSPSPPFIWTPSRPVR